jgi:hypothetical protein
MAGAWFTPVVAWCILAALGLAIAVVALAFMKGDGE